MNAAKSKSCVITSKEAAKTLIGFYVDPRPRAPRQAPGSESDTEVEEEEGTAPQGGKKGIVGRQGEAAKQGAKGE